MQRSKLILAALMSFMASCGPSVKESNEAAPGKNISETELLDSWPDDGPELLWSYHGLGKGYGGPLITRGGIYINGEENGNSYTICLEHNGTLRWKSPNGKEFMGSDYSANFPGTRSAPVARGGMLYAASGTGHLSCFDTTSGKVIWVVDLVKEYNGIPGDFGYSESPAVDENRVYCFTGGKVHNMVALDRHTGELVWSSPLKRDFFSYSTPVLLSLPDRNILVGTSRNYIHVVDRQDGKLLSSYTLEDIRVGYEHCNSVVHQDGYIYFVPAEEHGQGSVRLQLSADGEDLKEIWRNTQVFNVFEGFVVQDNRLYTTMENKKLLGLDTGTGRILSSTRAESGSIVCSGHKLIIYGHNGKVQLFGLEDGTPALTSEFRIREGSGQHFSFPVIAGGVMYIRRGNALMAFAVS